MTDHKPLSRLGLLAVLALVIAAGIAWRYAPLGIAPFAWKYGGSALWAVMVYVLVLLGRPSAGIGAAVLAASTISLAVEFSRLLSIPWLDAFRLTLAGQLTLGRAFSMWNLVAYGAGIAVAALVHHFARDRASR